MNRLILIAGLLLLLTGCAAQTTFETVEDVYVQPVSEQTHQMTLALPDNASALTVQSDEGGNLYFCDGYTLSVQVMQSGDLEETLRQTTGFGKDQLQPLQTQYGQVKRYDCVFACAGEGEDQIGRAAVLDDGVNHYVLCCMAEASQAQQLQSQWQELFSSFRLLSQEELLRTGS